MTPQELRSAVRCYTAMRRAVLSAGRTPGASINVTLAETRSWSAAQVWRQIWPLFFYSGMKETFARPRAVAAVAGGWFDVYSTLATANSDPEHLWHVREVRATKRLTTGTRKGKRQTSVSYVAVGKHAASFCSRTGVYSSMPYRTGAKVVHRVSDLASFFATFEELTSAPKLSLVDRLAGGNATTPSALNIAYSKLHPATGPVTALHALSDLGFPCHKPDIWMCRLASWCGWTPGYTPEDLMKNRREGWHVLRNACNSIATEAVRQGKVKDINPLRALDWYVANYGMEFEPKANPCGALRNEA